MIYLIKFLFFWLRSIHFLDFISIITPASGLCFKGQFMWKNSFDYFKEVTVYVRICESTKTPTERR